MPSRHRRTADPRGARIRVTPAATVPLVASPTARLVCLAAACLGASGLGGNRLRGRRTRHSRCPRAPWRLPSRSTRRGFSAPWGLLAHDSMRGRGPPEVPSSSRRRTGSRDGSRSLGFGPAFGVDYLQWYETQGLRGPNVAGPPSGAGTRLLADEYVVYTAHMDHVGVGTPDETGDSIYNGADDDASGTAVVLELAEAFAALPSPPRRSIVFLLVSGEEQGLWGSRHFTRDAPMPVESIVANLNADMLGRNWDDRIVVIGKEHFRSGQHRGPRSRVPTPSSTCSPSRTPGRTRASTPAPTTSTSLAWGSPCSSSSNGVHEDYHRPSDEVDRVNGEKAARIGRLMFYTGLEGRPARRADHSGIPAAIRESRTQEGTGRDARLRGGIGSVGWEGPW